MFNKFILLLSVMMILFVLNNDSIEKLYCFQKSNFSHIEFFLKDRINIERRLQKLEGKK